ncbi:hypothetical protein RhiirB3_409518, partial [Rhizophagus irregularis]
MSCNNEDEIQIESEFNTLSISNRNSIINHENCYRPNDDKLWCKECVPRCIIEGWTSGNNDVKQIGEGGFAKVYSATWIDGKADYKRQNDKSWKKEELKPIK